MLHLEHVPSTEEMCTQIVETYSTHPQGTLLDRETLLSSFHGVENRTRREIYFAHTLRLLIDMRVLVYLPGEARYMLALPIADALASISVVADAA
jgi:hypothetical protein